MDSNFHIYFNYINHSIFNILIIFIIFVISFILFEKINKNGTYNKSITYKAKGISTPPSGPNPPKPPKKNWRDKVKEHFSQYKYIYIGVGVVILGGILYISFGNGDPRSGSGGAPQTPQTRLNFPNRFNLGAPSGSTFGRSENMQNFMNFASHEALKNKAIDQVYQSPEGNQYNGLKQCVNTVFKLVLTFNPDLSSFGNSEQNLSEVQGLHQNESIAESLTVEEIDNLISEDIENSKSEEREPSNFRTLLPTILEGDLDEMELDRFVDSIGSSTRESNHTNIQLSQEAENDLSSLNQRDLRKFLEARNLAYYRNLSSSNLDYYQDRLTGRIDEFVRSDNSIQSRFTESTHYNLYEYKLPNDLDDLIEEVNELTSLSYNPDNLCQEASSEWNNLAMEIEKLAASRIDPSLNVTDGNNLDKYYIDDIIYLRETQHPELSVVEVINMLIAEEIGNPTALTDLITNNKLNEATGAYFVEEETAILIRKFDRSIFQYLYSELNNVSNEDFTRSPEFYSLVMRYLEQHNFSRLQGVNYNREGELYNEFIKRVLDDILSNEPSIGDYVNGDRERLLRVLNEISAVILSEAVEYMMYPYVFSYNELNKLIQLYLALQEHLWLGSLTTLDLLILGIGTT